MGRERAIAIATKHVVEVDVGASRRDVSAPRGEHEAVAVVSAAGRPQLRGRGDDEPMSFPRQRHRAGRRITADARENGRAISGMHGEALVGAQGHRCLAI